MRQFRYPFLIPEMPTAEELQPFLAQIDHHRYYANFGPLVQAFETQLRQTLADSTLPAHLYLATCQSGTAGLELAIEALDLPKPAHILIPALSFVATATAVVRTGHIPIFADVDPHTWSLSVDIAEQARQTLRYDAVIPVAAFGLAQPIDAWDAWYEKTGIPVIIDAAGAFGEQRIGQYAPVIFSLHATKLFGIGEGGLVVSRDDLFIQTVREMTQFGLREGTLWRCGTNSKLSEYHAAVGLAQLQTWPRKQVFFRALREQYQFQLRQHLPTAQYQTPEPRLSRLMAIHTETSHDQWIAYCHARGIEAKKSYLPLLPAHPALDIYSTVDSLDTANTLAQKIFCLPFHGGLNQSDLATIAEIMGKSGGSV